MKPQQNRTGRVLGLLLLVAVLGSQGAAIDLNSSTSLRYFPDNNLEFQVQTDGTIQPQGDIELDGNNIDTSGNTITLRDSTNTQDILRAQEGGNLEIPNGNLNVGADDLVVDVSNNRVRINATSYLGDRTHLQVGDREDGKNEYAVFDGIRISGDDRGNTIYQASSNVDLSITTNGGDMTLGSGADEEDLRIPSGSDNVEIPNGNLDVSGNNITSIDTLKFEEGTSIDGNVSIEGNIDTTGDINLSDNDLLDANNVQTSRLVDPEDEQINIDDNINLQNNQNIRSSGTNAITLDNNQNIGIPNGNLDMQGNRIVDTTGSDTVRVGDADSNTVRIDAGRSGETVVSSGDGGSGSTERLRVTSSGGEADVDVSNSDVDLQGNSVTSSGGEVCIGDQCA